ncbi:MAG: hypothetical protein WCF57_06945 [Pyrinomonadaceae bacterium]
MKNYSLLIKLICCALVVSCAFGLSQSPSSSQGRSLTARQLDAIVKPSLAQCSPQSGRLKSGKTKGRLDPALVIPTRNAREFPKDRIAKTLHGMWRGEVFGDYNKDKRVDYFWIIDTQRNEGLIIAQRTGNQSMAGLRPVAKAPKITYLMCANEGYIPSSEGGSQIHEFTKVSDSIEDAPRILQKATGVKLRTDRPAISDMWQELVASGYFKSLPAIAFAGALFKPIQLDLVASEIGPAQVLLKWDGEYYGGGATQLKFAPGVPVKGVEYTQFVGTTATSGDFLVASPGNGKLYKVEAVSGANYDLAFDSVTFGPLQ